MTFVIISNLQKSYKNITENSHIPPHVDTHVCMYTFTYYLSVTIMAHRFLFYLINYNPLLSLFILNTKFFPAHIYFFAQQDFPGCPGNQPFSQEVLAPSSGKWYLEIKIIEIWVSRGVLCYLGVITLSAEKAINTHTHSMV